MKALLIVAGILAAAAAAHAEPLIAYEHDGLLTVAKVGDDAMTTVVEEPNAGILEYTFGDANTLWVMRATKGVYSVEKIAGGKVDKRVLTPADFKAAPGKPAARVPRMQFTKSGEVWIHRCVTVVHDAEKNVDRCPERWLRLDAQADVADKPPKDVRYDDPFPLPDDYQDGPRKLKGPKGYTFAIAKNSFTCTAPKHSMPWKGGTRWVYSAQWVSQDPAIVHFYIGKYDSFDEAQSEADSGAGEFFVEDCNTILVDVKRLEDGTVATSEGGGAWKLRRGAKQIGAFTASHVEVALPPPPAADEKK